MRYVYGVYKYGSEDQTLLGLFNFEHEAEKCKIYLNDLGKHAFYEGFYVNDYLMDVRSDKLK